MAFQTSIETYSQPYQAGQIASLNNLAIYQAIPGLRNLTVNAIPYGRFVRIITATSGVELPSATGQTMAGVTIMNSSNNDFFDSAVHGVQPQDYADVLSVGDVCVSCEVTTAKPGDPVFVRHTANGGLNVIGGVANAAGTGLDAVASARFVSTVSNGLAVINVNLP